MRTDFPFHTCSAIAKGITPSRDAMLDLVAAARTYYDRANNLHRTAIDDLARINRLEAEVAMLKEALMRKEGCDVPES